MSETTLQKKISAPLKEKGQYVLAFGVIAVMLFVYGFPSFVIFFLGVLSYFILKMSSSGARIESRRIFEFYISANEVLREDERRWYGFEIQETISKGETIVRSMSSAPPLLYYALGALCHKIGDHAAAVKYLSYALEDMALQEFAVVFPTPELRDYVRLLRKIERDTAEAPLTSAAVRSLERSRKNLGKKLLDESRGNLESASRSQIENGGARSGSFKEMVWSEESAEANAADIPDETAFGSESGENLEFEHLATGAKPSEHQIADPFSDRKSISEVLHDIYDKNIQ